MTDLRPDEKLPDLELRDHAGNERRLSDLVGGDPTFLHFYRGWWCPKEQTFFRSLIALQDEAEVAYARILSVSVDEPKVAAAFRAGLGARWTFLCDPDRAWLRRLGLRETTDTTNDPYLPVGFLLEPDLSIHATWDGYWYWGRPSIEEIREGFRAVSQKLRPDWEGPAG